MYYIFISILNYLLKMEKKELRYGLTKDAEKLNGQVAMIAFVLILIIEYFTKNNIL